MTRRDFTNQRFGRLVAMSRGPNDKYGKSTWNCSCDCGNQPTVLANRLQNGKTKSCGCFKHDLHFKHGQTRKTSEYKAWDSMIQRTNNPNHPAYKNYGGRGITVCAEWRKSFISFFNYIGKKPLPKLSLDRINNEGNYEPGNVRWATMSEQQRNKRRKNQMLKTG